MVKTVLFVVGLVALLGCPVWAQDSAPYVSRLVAQASSQSVVLTWKDAEEFPGATYEVWRSDGEILKDSLSRAKIIASVPSGVEAYEDTTVSGPSYYLVLLKDSQGNRFAYYIPFRNKTTTTVQPLGPGEGPTVIRVQGVTYAHPQVVIAFRATPTDRKLLVFRKTQPITATADLKDATLLGTVTGAQAPYRDTPPPGLEFYYAIVDAQAWTDGQKTAFQFGNATDHAVGFPLLPTDTTSDQGNSAPGARPPVDSARSLPIPRLQVGTEPDSGAPMVPEVYEPVAPQTLTPGTESVLKHWSKGTQSGPTPLPPGVILPEERSANEDGAGRYLVQIQQAYLGPEDWKTAAESLTTVLHLALDPKTEARTEFYLGEAHAHLGDYRRAFVEFLAARDLYPNETKPFLEALFSLLEASSN